MTNAPLEEVLTAREAATLIGVSKQMVNKLCARGILTHRRADRSLLLLLKCDVEKYARERPNRKEVAND